MTAPSSFAFFHSGSNTGSARATWFTLLNTIAPGSPSCFIARSSSIGAAVGSFRGSVASAEKRPRPLANDRRKGVVHPPSQIPGEFRCLDVHAGRGERQELRPDAVLVEHLRAVVDVPMATDEDVVVARVVHAGIALVVDRDLHSGRARLVRATRRRSRADRNDCGSQRRACRR